MEKQGQEPVMKVPEITEELKDVDISGAPAEYARAAGEAAGEWKALGAEHTAQELSDQAAESQPPHPPETPEAPAA
jgi:hypothetical protein